MKSHMKKINENGRMISWAVRWKFKSNQGTVRGERMIALSFERVFFSWPFGYQR